jgi:hypothetical protein
MFDYVLTWPVWLLTTEDSLVRDQQGKPTGFTERPGFDVVREGNKARLVAFTDEDLANRYIARHKAPWVKAAFETPRELCAWLRSAANDGVTHVLFDPEPVGTSYIVESVIAALER